MILASADNSNQRFYSMSAQIRKEQKGYYEILEETQKGNLDINEWLIRRQVLHHVKETLALAT